MLFLCTCSLVADGHEPVLNLFRIFNMAFPTKATPHLSKVALNKVYVKFDSARGRPNYLYLAFFNNGLLFLSSKAEMRNKKKTYWQWSTYKLHGDTIIQLKYELPNLNSRGHYYMMLYQQQGDSCIKSISNTNVMDDSLSFEENFRRVAATAINQRSEEANYYLTVDIIPPSIHNCKFLRHAYFWQSDSLFREYKNNKIKIQ
jgi:hypothetical protein